MLVYVKHGISFIDVSFSMNTACGISGCRVLGDYHKVQKRLSCNIRPGCWLRGGGAKACSSTAVGAHGMALQRDLALWLGISIDCVGYRWSCGIVI